MHRPLVAHNLRLKEREHSLEVGQFGLLNLAHVPEQHFAHGIKGILPLKKFIEILFLKM
jgi:hypothetical protein